MQIFPTKITTSQRVETARSLANDLSIFWGEGEVCILRSPGIGASPISLLSMGGVCGRRLTAGKILFTGRQTCSLYLVLWLCGSVFKGCVSVNMCYCSLSSNSCISTEYLQSQDAPSHVSVYNYLKISKWSFRSIVDVRQVYSCFLAI